MDPTAALLLIIIAAVIGMVAVLLTLRRDRRAAEDPAHESPFAVSSEGMKRCPSCGAGNLVTDATCVSCGRPLPG